MFLILRMRQQCGSKTPPMAQLRQDKLDVDMDMEINIMKGK